MSRTIEVIVRLTISEVDNISEIVSEMDYEFIHPAILDSEIVDVNTEI